MAAWPHDPVMVDISTLHGPELSEEHRSRRTIVAEEDGVVVGAAALVSTARHPTFSFFTVVVTPTRRRTGIASALLAQLRSGSIERPLLARVRETDDAGIAFLQANGFGVVMRARQTSVDPDDPEIVSWIGEQRPIALERPAGREEAARAHELAYGRVHAGWAPPSDRPLEESLLARRRPAPVGPRTRDARLVRGGRGELRALATDPRAAGAARARASSAQHLGSGA